MAPTMPPTLCIDHRSNPPSKTVELESSENKRTESGILEVLMKYIRFDEWFKFSEDVLGLQPKDIVQYRQKFEEFVANMKKEMIEKSRKVNSKDKELRQLLSEHVSKQNLISRDTLMNKMKYDDNMMDSKDLIKQVLDSRKEKKTEVRSEKSSVIDVKEIKDQPDEKKPSDLVEEQDVRKETLEKRMEDGIPNHYEVLQDFPKPDNKRVVQQSKLEDGKDIDERKEAALSLLQKEDSTEVANLEQKNVKKESEDCNIAGRGDEKYLHAERGQNAEKLLSLNIDRMLFGSIFNPTREGMEQNEMKKNCLGIEEKEIPIYDEGRNKVKDAIPLKITMGTSNKSFDDCRDSNVSQDDTEHGKETSELNVHKPEESNTEIDEMNKTLFIGEEKAISSQEDDVQCVVERESDAMGQAKCETVRHKELSPDVLESGHNDHLKALEKETMQSEVHGQVEEGSGIAKGEENKTVDIEEKKQISFLEDAETVQCVANSEAENISENELGKALQKSNDCRRVEKEITAEGGELQIEGCKVSFPTSAVDEAMTVSILVNLDISKWPKDQMGVTPFLQCYSSRKTNFNKPLTVELTTWLIPEDVMTGSFVSVMHYSRAQTPEWKEIATTAPNEYGKIIFQIDNFCGFISTVCKILGWLEKPISISAFLLHRDKCNFVGVFCRDIESFENKVMKKFENYHVSLPLNTLVADRKDKITFALKCKDLKFKCGEHVVKVETLLEKEMHFEYFTPEERIAQCEIVLEYSIKHDKDTKPRLYDVPLEWPVSAKAGGGNVTVFQGVQVKTLHNAGKDYSVTDTQ